MKNFYSGLLVLIMIYCSNFVDAQTCPNGQPSGGTAYDTTIAFGSGIESADLKFPKFDPQNGLVTCVKLCVTIKGVIDTMAFENLSTGAVTGNYNYTRKDTIRGPGIPTFLSSNATVNGSFPLGATDGWNNSGPDFYSQGSDTILTRVLCSNINDSATIAQFYGVAGDSVLYNYAVDAKILSGFSSGSGATLILSSAFVNFNFQYCTCPSATLPLDVHEFTVEKAARNRAQLSWKGFDEVSKTYHYEVEVSQNGYNFRTVQSVAKGNNGQDYTYIYTTGRSESQRYFFRIKQIYSNGYTRFSEVKSIDLENSDVPKINIYPNPSSGVVGIKFVNTNTGKFLVQISNTQGQTVFSKEIEVRDEGYKYVTTLQRGMYWLRLIDVTSHLSCVNQLLIK